MYRLDLDTLPPDDLPPVEELLATLETRLPALAWVQAARLDSPRMDLMYIREGLDPATRLPWIGVIGALTQAQTRLQMRVGDLHSWEQASERWPHLSAKEYTTGRETLLAFLAAVGLALAYLTGQGWEYTTHRQALARHLAGEGVLAHV